MQIVGVPSGYVGRGVTAVGCKNGVGEALRALGFRGCWLRSPPQKGPAPVAWYTSEAGCRWRQRVMYEQTSGLRKEGSSRIRRRVR